MAKIPARILRMYVPGATLADALPHLRETYCGPIAYEIEHIASHRQRLWLREAIESGSFRKPLTNEEQKALLKRLTEVDALERFMHKAYLGQKQFSIEGLDMTVPMLDEIDPAVRHARRPGGRDRDGPSRPPERARAQPRAAVRHDLRRVRGVLDARADHDDSPGRHRRRQVPPRRRRAPTQLPSGESIIVRLESNPSHLEFVAPVASGATRAAQTTRQGPHAHQDTNAAIPIILHGDAAFPGQGVVAETLNLQALDGYTVGGTIHIIQNNQVGFTTDPEDARSTTWASDLAKGFDVPIIHVNADDVAACISAVRLAFAFRQEFGHDVLIDLIGYRRFGHNEADEPAYTQPEMYQVIKKHPPVRELFAKQLIERGVVTEQESTEMTDQVWAVLTDEHQKLKAQDRRRQGARARDRRVPARPHGLARGQDRRLRRPAAGAQRGAAVGPGRLHGPPQARQAARAAPRGAAALRAGSMWAHAESLAFASLLTEGIPIRLTGQDAERGTFSQRHLVLHDPRTGQEHCAMQHLPGALAPMELHNSPLSEMACLGFEYGYSQEGPETLVLWEAQFGDFVNGAQVIIDQFIVSGLAKWGQTSRLTLLLPHGYEGSGPEHSSARLERFLQLAAEGNIRVANCTTPAQYFHLLRRQARIAKQRPLVIMTPKSLLRLPQATSRLEELAEGRFQPVLAEPGVDPEQVTRLVLCSGKIYYDLIGHASRADRPGVAIGRVELLYPFPQAEILSLVASYPRLTRSCGCRRSRATWAPAPTCRRACCRSCPRTSSSATSVVPSAPPRARATRSPTPASRTGSSRPRSTCASRSRSTRASCRASGRGSAPSEWAAAGARGRSASMGGIDATRLFAPDEPASRPGRADRDVALGALLLGAGPSRAATRPYVSLGDSYTSAPLVPNPTGNPIGCGRSTNNYPSDVARTIAPSSFTDASCASATTVA